MIWSKDVDIAIIQIDGRSCRSKLLALNPPDLRCKELWLPAPGLINSHHSTFTITALGSAPSPYPTYLPTHDIWPLRPLTSPPWGSPSVMRRGESLSGGEFESDAAFSSSPPPLHQLYPTWWGSHNCLSHHFFVVTNYVRRLFVQEVPQNLCIQRWTHQRNT